MIRAQPLICPLNLQVPDKEVRHGHLKLGGRSPAGDELAVNSYYLTLNGGPFIVVSGEFQPTRYPSAYWEEELLKIKGGGINTIAFYVFWIHHEETEDGFDWGGDKDIRRFVELIAKHGLFAIVRIGPFVHGECRNGGLPDWLYGQPWEVRSNHPAYLGKVQRYYGQIGAQLDGLFFQDGGPIIGLQLENEYEHSGAPWEVADRGQPMEFVPVGKDGVSHMGNLRRLAAEAGMVAPLLTLTGWDSPIL
jgi:beta-galactosidase